MGGNDTLRWGMQKFSADRQRKADEEAAAEAQKQGMGQRIMDSGFSALQHMMTSNADQDRLDKQFSNTLLRDREESKLKSEEAYRKRAHELLVENMRLGGQEDRDAARATRDDQHWKDTQKYRQADLEIKRQAQKNKEASAGARTASAATRATEMLGLQKQLTTLAIAHDKMVDQGARTEDIARVRAQYDAVQAALNRGGPVPRMVNEDEAPPPDAADTFVYGE